MPGILPMKMIKVGTGAQARIAQACDRCRSKKIRCDGVRPSCTQCINVGFECKTSDKLSRRAFPRGYTESLEERVRALEAEVRELRDLLDEKEEKLEMLSRVRAQTSPTAHSDSSPKSTASSDKVVSEKANEDEETFTIVQSPTLADAEKPEAYYMGTSSFRSLMTAFKRRVSERRRGSINFDVDSIMAFADSRHVCSQLCSGAPALMLSDRLVNTFFQEFAPLFPILHRPSFLGVYNEYVISPASINDKKSLAQLYFAFAIASLSKHSGATAKDVAVLECQGVAALESFMSEATLATVQCLTLATLYFMMKSDWSTMLRYKGQAVAFAQRLGLHQSQKRFSLDSLTVETRRRVFWTIFALDCFSAAHLGLPTLLSDVDVQCEFPFDADDEYITPKGFLPSLPGESTRLSSALALFRLTKILSKILSELYPAKASHKLSFKAIASLQDELDTWSLELSPHLKLQFEKDKPFTGVVSHRSPLLSLAFHYTHTFISRPAVLASPSLASRCSPSIISLAASSKRMVQIIDLLEERNLALAFCFGEKELLQQSAVGLLLQYMEMGSELKLIGSVFDKFESCDNSEFKKLSEIIKDKQGKTNRHSNSEIRIQSSSKKDEKRKSSSSKSSRSPDSKERKSSRKSLPFLPPSSESMSAYNTNANMFARSEPSLSPSQQSNYPVPRVPASGMGYMSIDTPSNVMSFADPGSGMKDEGADWVQMLSNLDNGHSNIYDNIYGGPGNETANAQPPSLGDYSSLASNSPRTLQSVPQPKTGTLRQDSNTRSMQCDTTTDLWTIVPDFRSPVEGIEGVSGSPLSSIDDIGGVSNGGLVTDTVGRDEFSLFEAFM